MSPIAERVEGHICHQCDREADRWFARCPFCGAWSRTAAPAAMPARRASAQPAPRRHNDIRPVDAEMADPSPTPREIPRSVPVPLPEVDLSTRERRIETGIEPLDRVLGGGIVAGSMILIGGPPGGGKSTLIMQAMASARCEGVRLYATGEESTAQVAERAHRMGAVRSSIEIVRETDLDDILWHAQNRAARLVAIDSLHTVSSRESSGSAGDVQQIVHCAAKLMNFTKSTEISTIVISHINADGEVSGPKKLEHLGDVTMMLELMNPRIKDDPGRRLVALKNRFGAQTEIGLFLMGAGGLDPILPGAELPRSASGDEFLPIAQELLHRFLELGGEIDGGLRDRISGRLDLTPRGSR